MNLSLAQKIVKYFTSASLFKKIMEDSKRYRFTCSCGKEASIWDIGGIRYKAYGKPRTRIKCPHCGKFAMKNLQNRSIKLVVTVALLHQAD